MVFIIYLLHKSGSRLHPSGKNYLYDRSSYTCCQRPCNLACGVFWRIVIRESLSAVGAVCVLFRGILITQKTTLLSQWPEDKLVTFIFIFIETTVLVCFTFVAYILGAFLGRWVDATWDIDACSCPNQHS